MSNSYKKTPYCGDTKHKEDKRLANKKIRQWLKIHPEAKLFGKNYKKIFNTWNICDYSDITTWEQFWNHQLKLYYEYKYLYEPYPNKEKIYQNWLKYYKRK